MSGIALENTNQQWTVNNVVSAVLLSILMIVLFVVASIGGVINDFVGMVLSTAIGALLAAPVYMLMISRVKKRFTTSVFMILTGIMFTLMSNWTMILLFFVGAVICEAILWNDGWNSVRKITSAWIVASLTYAARNFVPVWFFWDTYQEFIAAAGGQEMVDTMVRYFADPMWVVIIIILTAAGAWIGSLIGASFLSKHFTKAGVL
ncbi:MAG: MptD family putative ECF transporter S component [Chloroflexota bacterium]